MQAVEQPADEHWSAVHEAREAKERLEAAAAEVETKARAAFARVTDKIEAARSHKHTKVCLPADTQLL